MKREKLLGLTGIRFYAALFVYFSHVVETIPGMGTLGGHFLVFNAGVVGVSFFFVLSGFILTYNYAEVFREGVDLSSYKRFVWDRLVRIYPVHLLALLVVAPMAILSTNFPLDWRSLPLHLLLLQSWWPSSAPPFYRYFNVPSWSLSCEWFFYLLAPLAMYFVIGNIRRWILLGLAMGYAVGLSWILWNGREPAEHLYLVSWFAPSRFVEFSVGVALARVFLAPVGPKLAGFACLLQASGVVVLIASAICREYAPWPFWGGLLYVPGSALLILGIAYRRGYVARHLSHPWLQRLGVASFAFYMIHAPLLRATKNSFILLGWEVHTWPLFWGVGVTLLVVIQLAAFIVCFAYEIPLQSRLRALIRQ